MGASVSLPSLLHGLDVPQEPAAERHRGALNDAVLTTVRTSTVEELSDPRLAAVKARLSEITRPMLGEDMVRQLVLNRVDAEQMRQKETKKEKPEHGGH
jgi:hypothetical protein